MGNRRIERKETTSDANGMRGSDPWDAAVRTGGMSPRRNTYTAHFICCAGVSGVILLLARASSVKQEP